MTYRMMFASVLFCCTAFTTESAAQPGDRHLNLEARVLNLLFPLDVSRTKPYVMKLVLRYGDSDTQLIVLAYPGGKSEMVRFDLADMNRRGLSQVVSEAVAENPGVTDREIAARLKVNVTRSPIDDDALFRALKDLETVRISPVLASRVPVDQYSEYEYWYDTWQECVRYTIAGPFKDSDQDKLVQWMVKFRTNATSLVTPPSAPNGQRPVAQSVDSDEDMIEYDRRLASHYKASFPAAGVIPDAETAKAIAAAVAIPIWGKETVQSELPLRAGLKGNVRTVIGDPHLKGGEVGGELIIQLDKKTGAVLAFLHTQ